LSGGGWGLAADDSAVDRRTSDTEQVSEFQGRVLTGVQQFDQMRFLARVEFGLLSSEMTFRFRNAHALASPGSDEVGNSATMARTLNSSRPTGSVGS